jgi:glycosyltransferase involved in cell wall biosynthesis
MKICQISSVHKWNDTRIFFKECLSLAEAGHEVHLVIPNAKETTEYPVKIHNVDSKSESRLLRATWTCFRILLKVFKIRPKVVHFHDPELIWVGLICRLFGMKVVFDIHENIRGQILVKEWLPFNRKIAKFYGLFDWVASKFFYLIIAEESYQSIYEPLTKNLELVMNLPDTSKLANFKIEDRRELDPGLFYLGGVMVERGIMEILSVISQMKKKGTPVHFHCVGPFETGVEAKVRPFLKENEIDDSVTFYGALPVYEAFELSRKCKMGISLLHPVPNYMKSYSTKIFEYMSVGLPFVVSDFELYYFVKEKKLGLLVDPFSLDEIESAITKGLSDNDWLLETSKRGIYVAATEFNWKTEKKKLLTVYSSFEK